jgi:probable HAF family extracellular repeat protein
MRVPVSTLVGLATSTLTLPSASVAVASFTGLGNLGGHSLAYGISADGSVVVGVSDTATGQEAFRWSSNAGMVGLGSLLGGSPESKAFGVSADGSVVVGESASDQADFEAFLWTPDAGMVGLGDLLGAGTTSSAYGTSADGSVIVGVSNGHAFRWTSDGGAVSLGFSGYAYATSSDGSVVVGARAFDLTHPQAFRWTTDSGIVGLGYLPGAGPGGFAQSYAIGTSADGSFVVGYSSSESGVQAFRWTAESGMVGLGDLPGGFFDSRAFGVSGDGSIVVGESESDLDVFGNAFIWDGQHGMRPLEVVLSNDYGLDLEGWDLESARAISADGLTIVGYGVNPDGLDEAWIATIPEPGTGLLILSGLFGLGARRKRRA